MGGALPEGAAWSRLKSLWGVDIKEEYRLELIMEQLECGRRPGVFLGTLDEIENKDLQAISRIMLKIKPQGDETESEFLEIDMKILDKTFNRNISPKDEIVLTGKTLENNQKIFFEVTIQQKQYILVYFKPILDQSSFKKKPNKLISLAEMAMFKYMNNLLVIQDAKLKPDYVKAFLKLNAIGRVYDKEKKSSNEAMIFNNFDFLKEDDSSAVLNETTVHKMSTLWYNYQLCKSCGMFIDNLTLSSAVEQGDSLLFDTTSIFLKSLKPGPIFLFNVLSGIALSNILFNNLIFTTAVGALDISGVDLKNVSRIFSNLSGCDVVVPHHDFLQKFMAVDDDESSKNITATIITDKVECDVFIQKFQNIPWSIWYKIDEMVYNKKRLETVMKSIITEYNSTKKIENKPTPLIFCGVHLHLFEKEDGQNGTYKPLMIKAGKVELEFFTIEPNDSLRHTRVLNESCILFDEHGETFVYSPSARMIKFRVSKKTKLNVLYWVKKSDDEGARNEIPQEHTIYSIENNVLNTTQKDTMEEMISIESYQEAVNTNKMIYDSRFNSKKTYYTEQMENIPSSSDSYPINEKSITVTPEIHQIAQPNQIYNAISIPRSNIPQNVIPVQVNTPQTPHTPEINIHAIQTIPIQQPRPIISNQPYVNPTPPHLPLFPLYLEGNQIQVKTQMGYQRVFFSHGTNGIYTLWVKKYDELGRFTYEILIAPSFIEFALNGMPTDCCFSIDHAKNVLTVYRFNGIGYTFFKSEPIVKYT